MVGLPARGKTYTARKIERYMRWYGFRTALFNVGNVRRELSGAAVPHQFFDPLNELGMQARRQAAQLALDSMLEFFAGGGEIAIFDATNSTLKRRSWLRNQLENAGVELAFVESICDDPKLIEANIRRTKVGSPDYYGVDAETAIEDFRARIAHYDSVYEPLCEENVPWIKIVDAGRQVVFNRLEGPMLQQVGRFLMSLNLVPADIWFSRHGQSLFNTQNRVGGDSPLSPAGRLYAQSLGRYMTDRVAEVWTSTLQRTIQTASYISASISRFKMLDEIHAGVCDALSYSEISTRFPLVSEARKRDKLRYRYPQGESYEDLIRRVEPIILMIEHRQDPILVVAHQAVLRALVAYFTDRPREEVPHLPVPLHTLISLRPNAYGCEEMRFSLPPHT